MRGERGMIGIMGVRVMRGLGWYCRMFVKVGGEEICLCK